MAIHHNSNGRAGEGWRDGAASRLSVDTCVGPRYCRRWTETMETSGEGTLLNSPLATVES
jgi:hypothetical protein